MLKSSENTSRTFHTPYPWQPPPAPLPLSLPAEPTFRTTFTWLTYRTLYTNLTYRTVQPPKRRSQNPIGECMVTPLFICNVCFPLRSMTHPSVMLPERAMTAGSIYLEGMGGPAFVWGLWLSAQCTRLPVTVPELDS